MIKLGGLVVASKTELQDLILKERRREVARIYQRKRNGTSKRAKRRVREVV